MYSIKNLISHNIEEITQSKELMDRIYDKIDNNIINNGIKKENDLCNLVRVGNSPYPIWYRLLAF
jgi:hypothetical protein